MEILVLLGAEGLSEIDGVPWMRDATRQELEVFKAQRQISEADFEELCLDRSGRPYFLMALRHDAPPEVRVRAQGAIRLLRLYP